MGHYGNELADQLAKEGAHLALHGPEPYIPIAKPILTSAVISAMTTAWSERWKDRKDSRQTGIFFPQPDPKKSQKITTLSKATIGMVVRAL